MLVVGLLQVSLPLTSHDVIEYLSMVNIKLDLFRARVPFAERHPHIFGDNDEVLTVD